MELIFLKTEIQVIDLTSFFQMFQVLLIKTILSMFA